MKYLTNESLLEKLNIFANLDLNINDSKNILFTAKNNNINYFINDKNKLFKEYNNTQTPISCNVIIEDYIKALKLKSLNSIGNEKYSLDNQITRFKTINSKILVGQDEYYFSIRKNNDYLKEKIQNNNEEKNNSSNLWNTFNLKQKAAVLAEINERLPLLQPETIINYFNRIPSAVNNYLDDKKINEIKNINDNSIPNILYNIFEKAYEENLEPSNYMIKRFYDNDIVQINYTNNKENGKLFINSLCKHEDDLLYSQLYNKNNNELIYEASKYRTTDFEKNIKNGCIKAEELTELYNKNNPNQKIENNTSQIILDYLESNRRSILWNDNILYMKDNYLGYQHKTDINDILDKTINIAEKEKNKIIENNIYKRKLGKPVILLSEGTLKESQIIEISKKLKDNYNNIEDKEYNKLNSDIRKLENKKNQLSINNTIHLENNNSSQNNNKTEKINQIEKFLHSGLTDIQIDTILKATEDIAKNISNTHSSKRSR